MKLHHLTLTIEQLRNIPDAERALFVLLAHALNEINSLNKLLFLSSRVDDLPMIKAHAQLTQGLMLARVLHGKLSELWAVLVKGYFGTKLSQKYLPLLDAPAAAGLTALKRYFGPSNVVNTVRNEFAFHYSLIQAITSIPDDTPPEELAIYLHESDGSSLYYFAEFLMRKALLEAITPGDHSDAVDGAGASRSLNRFFTEMSAMVEAVNAFSQGFIFLVIDSHIGRDALLATARDIEVGDVPESDDAQIPFFINISPPKKPRN